MIRALALFLLAALPVTAQDFRGLRPGMHVSELERLGEPEIGPYHAPDDHARVHYELPYDELLVVAYDDAGTIAFLSTSGCGASHLRPGSEGLEICRMTLAQVAQQLGAGVDLAVPGVALNDMFAQRTTIYLASLLDDDVILGLTFLVSEQIREPGERQVEPPLADEALFVSASLQSRSFFEQLASIATFFGDPETDLPSFPVPLEQAFPRRFH